MSATTTNMGLTKPSMTDTADITVLDTDLDILDVHHHGTNASGLAVRRINSGVFASRPAFGTPGQVYISTDTGIISYDLGASWVDGITLTSTSNLTGKTYTATITGATSAARFVGGTAAVAPVAGTFVAGDFVTTLTGGMFICTVGGSPGTWVQVGPTVAVTVLHSVAVNDTIFALHNFI
jgi:hypothetical protein